MSPARGAGLLCNANHRRSTHHDRRSPNPLAGPVRAVPGRPDDRARHDHRQRRAALHPHGSRLHRELAGLGGQRLPADLWRLPAAGRAAGRPVRPPAPVSVRHRPLHRGLPGLRALHHPGHAGGRAGRAGAGRRGGLRRVAVADDDALHRAGRPSQGDGRVRLRLLRRRQHRRAAGRRSDQLPELALDLPGQLPDRHRRLPAGAAAGAVHAHPALPRPGWTWPAR